MLPRPIREKLRGWVGPQQNRLNRLRYGGGTDIMEEDWDNLILLDACRFDVFSEVHSLDGQLEFRISRGSSSRGFLEENFADRTFHDTVYITANPNVGFVDEGVFHAVITLLDEWDEQLQTVTPDTVVEAVESEYELYDDKRIIVHFMQPHQPYLGDTADAIREKLSEAEVASKGWDRRLRQPGRKMVNELDGVKQLRAPLHPELDVSQGDVWTAYRETLDIALKHVEFLLDVVSGKTVISSDHGELIGEKPLLFHDPTYGHPENVWTEKLRKVPWFVTDYDKRREVTSDRPERYDEVSEEVLEDRLKAFGYID